MKRVVIVSAFCIAFASNAELAMALSCPLTISTAGTVTLTANDDFSDCGDTENEHGIRITASNVALDCDGKVIVGNAVPNTFGIYVTGSSLTNITVRNCTIQDFQKGIRVEGLNVKNEGTGRSGLIEDNHIANARCIDPHPGCGVCTDGPDEGDACHPPYGIELTGGSRWIHLVGNIVELSDDEGIHISGVTSSCAQSSDDPGGHYLADNAVMNNDREGIYLLCTDHNLIVDNDMEDNAEITNNGAGIFMDQFSSENMIVGNEFKNDTITVQNRSTKNAFLRNKLFEVGSAPGANVRIRFEGSSGNFADQMVIDSDDQSQILYDLLGYPGAGGSNCNQFVRSSGINLDLPGDHIHVAGNSTNNRFLRFTSDLPLRCDIEGGSSAQITDPNGQPPPPVPTPALCVSSTINPAQCAGQWWYASELCGEGGVQQEAASFDLSGEVVDDTRYLRATSGSITTGYGDPQNGTDPFTVEPDGCIRLSIDTSADSIVLGPGSVVELGGRLIATVD